MHLYIYMYMFNDVFIYVYIYIEIYIHADMQIRKHTHISKYLKEGIINSHHISTIYTHIYMYIIVNK
jgi:hypothetical protein